MKLYSDSTPLDEITEPWIAQELKEMRDLEEFGLKEEFLQSSYPSVSPTEFYRSIFPSGSFERLGHQEDNKGNGLAVSIGVDNEGKHRGALTVVTDGFEQLETLLEQPFVVMSPLSYYGRSRRADHALWMYALALDIDYVDRRGLVNILHHADIDLTPQPTFVVNSGHGVHLYYQFEQPIPMYRNTQTELKRLKTALIDSIWNKYTSTNVEAKEALGVVQGFRMVGSPSKLGMGLRLKAYRTGDEVTLEYLNDFVQAKDEAHIKLSRSKLTLAEARKKYPDWYQQRIVEGKAPGRWNIKRDLYDWWKREIETGAKVGHRYFCMMCLAIYAAKCNITEEELLQDAMHFQSVFDDLDKDGSNPFTVDEMHKALEAYNESYVTFPRETISRISGIAIPTNKRNGRKQNLHLRMARSNLAIMSDDMGFALQGRPKESGTKADQIRAYAVGHPEANHSQIARALGVSRTTVVKWLKS